MFVEPVTYGKMESGQSDASNIASTLTNFIKRGDEMADKSLPKRNPKLKSCDVSDCDRKVDSRIWCAKHYNRWRKHGNPLYTVFLPHEDEANFWRKVIKGATPDECWGWKGSIPKDKYGKPAYVSAQWKGGSVPAHRMSFYLANGYWPTNSVLHSCDNPPCTNPWHLRDGTVQDNSDDMVSRDRQAKGSQNSQSKLTEDSVPRIWELIRQGFTNLAIGQRFDVSPWAISLIRCGKTWKHVGEEPGMEKFNDALVGLEVYGERVLFTRARIRKATDCRQCRASMPKASIAFRPITNRDFRSERVHRECLAEYERTH